MIALFLSSTLSLFLFICFGFFAAKVLSIKSNSFEKVLLGFIIVNTLTCCVSIFTAISIFVTLTFIFTACIFLFFIRADLLYTAKTIRSNYLLLLVSIPFILIGFNISLQEPSVFDSGLYHIQCIKWIEEYPTVPGLANLHHRFGFNPIAFSLYALTSLHNLFDQEIFCINFVLFSILTVFFIQKLYNTFKHEGFNTYFIFYSIFFYVLILQSSKISSPSPDYVSSAFLLFIFLRVVEIQRSKITISFHAFIPIMLLSTYCIMAKLSAVPISLIIGYILYTYRIHWKEILRISSIACIICIPWFINTILLTGWLIYPFSAIDLFHFDWKVPVHIVHLANAEIVGWARSPDNFYYEVSQMSLIKWIPIWWSHLTIYLKLLITGSILFPVMLCIGQLLKIIPANRLLTTAVCTSVLGVFFWFFTAPDFRFGHIFIVFACCSPLLYFDFVFLFKTISFKQKNIVFMIVCAILLLKLIRNSYGSDMRLIARTFSTHYLKPERIHTENTAYTYVNVGNAKIYRPVSGERCFDHALPCSHIDLSSVTLRGNDLSKGFKPIRKDK